MILFRYLAALFYDAIILLSLFLGMTALCILFRNGAAIPSGTWWYQLSLFTVLYGYYSLSYQNGGQTIGMRAWRIKLQAEQPLTHRRILHRLFLFIPAGVYGMLSLQNPNLVLLRWTKTRMVFTP